MQRIITCALRVSARSFIAPNFCQLANLLNSISWLAVRLRVTRGWRAFCDALQTALTRASYWRETQRRKTDSLFYYSTRVCVCGGGINLNAFYREEHLYSQTACLSHTKHILPDNPKGLVTISKHLKKMTRSGCCRLKKHTFLITLHIKGMK